MATISATFIKVPKKERRCNNCDDKIIGGQFRLYGSATSSDPKYAIYICALCARSSSKNDFTLQRALKEAGLSPL